MVPISGSGSGISLIVFLFISWPRLLTAVSFFTCCIMYAYPGWVGTAHVLGGEVGIQVHTTQFIVCSWAGFLGHGKTVHGYGTSSFCLCFPLAVTAISVNKTRQLPGACALQQARGTTLAISQVFLFPPMYVAQVPAWYQQSGQALLLERPDSLAWEGKVRGGKPSDMRCPCRISHPAITRA